MHCTPCPASARAGVLSLPCYSLPVHPGNVLLAICSSSRSHHGLAELRGDVHLSPHHLLFSRPSETSRFGHTGPHMDVKPSLSWDPGRTRWHVRGHVGPLGKRGAGHGEGLIQLQHFRLGLGAGAGKRPAAAQRTRRGCSRGLGRTPLSRRQHLT